MTFRPPAFDPLAPNDAPAANDSGSRVLTKSEYRRLTEAQEEARRTAEDLARVSAESAAHATRIKRFIWATVGVVVSTVIGTLGVNSWAGGKVDAGIAPVEARVTKSEADIRELKSTTVEVQMRTVRIETMAEMLLKDQRIKPPPPVVVDGGR